MEILLNEPSPTPLHAIAAMVAIVVGAVQLYMKKGGSTHRILGRIWIGLILAVALSSLFIHEIRMWGPFSLIHLVSVGTILVCGRAVYLARVGKIKRHRNAMVSLYVFALVLTGLFTLSPGRVMHQIVFGQI